jgi:hypothetical protein
MEAVLSEPISPELALVCPELRAQAIAALVERERAVRRPASREYELMRSIASAEDDEEDEDEWVAPLPVAILAYTASSATKLAIEAAALLGVLIGVLSLVSFLHS